MDLVHGCLGAVPTLEHISRALDGNLRMYMGHGLLKKAGDMTNGEPLDAMTTVAVLANLEKSCFEIGLESPKSTIMVADAHAASVLSSERNMLQINQAALRKMSYLKAMSRLLSTKNVEVSLASNVHKKTEFQSLREKVAPSVANANAYTILELTDIVWFKENGVNVKLGWTNTPHEGGERVFDSKFRQSGLDDPNRPAVGFIYHIPGVDLKSGKPAPPYISRLGESRILLDSYTKEDVGRVIAESTPESLRHIQKIVKGVARLLDLEIEIGKESLGDWIFDKIILPIRSNV